MTRIYVYRHLDTLLGFQAKNHASYAEEGQDIVCAAVSVLTITAVNALQAFSIPVSCLVEKKKARITVHVCENISDEALHDAQIILKTMVMGLKDIEKQYPSYVKLIHEERRWNR